MKIEDLFLFGCARIMLVLCHCSLPTQATHESKQAEFTLTLTYFYHFMDKSPLQQIPTLHKFSDDDYLLFAQVLNNEQVMANVTGSAISEDDIQDAWNNRVRIINRQCELFGYYKIMVDAHYADYVKLTPNNDIFTEPYVEIGYFLLPEFWGKGIGFMAGCQLVQLAKSQSLPIVATVNRKNTISKKLLTKLKFYFHNNIELDEQIGELRLLDTASIQHTTEWL